MTDRPDGPTRRQLLGAVGGIGALGFGAGVSAAVLTDRQLSTFRFETGAVAIAVDCSSCFKDNGTIGVAFGELEPGDGGREDFVISVEENPSRLWIRSACPPVVDPLGEVLEVRLTLHDGSEQLFPVGDDRYGTLDELRDELSSGLRLDDRTGDGCLSTGEDLTLEFEYSLPQDADWTADLSTELRFELFAEQCRHVSEDGVENPFVDAVSECPELACPECETLGKLEVEDDRLEPGTYAFDELYGEFDEGGSAYELEVLTVTNKQDGDDYETVCASVRLLKNGDEVSAPPICAVEVAGGPDPEPDSPGPAVEKYEFDPPTTRSRGELCTADEFSAISHLEIAVCPDGGESE